MAAIPGGEFKMGSPMNEKNRLADEGPQRKVVVDSFWMAKHETTWNLFQLYMDREIDKNQIRDVNNEIDIDVDGVSSATTPYVEMSFGMGTDGYPAISMTQLSASKFCEWLSAMTGNYYRLPTEAEWESAAQGNFNDAVFSWGNEFSFLNQNANTWQGNFPIENTVLDKHESIAAVKSYPPNSIGIYDMIGNVWEITSDLFNVNHYKELDLNKSIKNPKGASSCYNPSNPYELQYIMKGGSFLCHDSYCASYRISARMGVSIGSASDHMGFRTVATLEMLNRN